MLWSIFRFEIRYHLKNPLFYITAGFMALMTFGAVTSDSVQIGGGIGNVYRNAPIVIIQFLSIMSVIGLFIVTAFVASSVHRDTELGTSELFFSRPIRKYEYLIARFLGSFFVSIALFLGPTIGILLGTLMPWLEAERLGPLAPAPYLFSLFVMIAPNVLFMACVFFTVAALTRSMMATYLGVVGFFVSYGIAQVLTGDLEAQWIGALLDPFGLAAIEISTKYWTIVEQNASLPPLGGLLLVNRLIWMSAGLVILALGCWRFNPSRSPKRRHKAAIKIAPDSSLSIPSAGAIRTPPRSQTSHQFFDHFRQAALLARFETTAILRSIPFVVIVVFGIFNLLASMGFLERMFGTSVLPVTGLMLESMSGSYLFLVTIIVTFYAGELIWRERTLGVNEVTDSLPVPSWVPLTAKITALSLVVLVFTAIGMVASMFFQFFHGYTRFEFLLYGKGFIVAVVPFLLIAVLAITVQILSKSKMLGYLFMIAFLLSSPILNSLDLSHRLYRFAEWPSAPYSDMNGYGHFVAPMVSFGLYWSFLALVMIGLCAALWRRGTDPSWRSRWSQAREDSVAGARMLVTLGLLGFVATGVFIFYNTNVLNEYVTNDVAEKRTAEYEKNYRRYLGINQPRITDVSADVDIYPTERRVEIRGTYHITNTGSDPIRELHINISNDVKINQLDLGPKTTRLEDRTLGYAIYDLENALQPGATMEFKFDLSVVNRGFVNNGAMNTVVKNGTFFNNRDFFPLFGYLPERELIDRNARRENELEPVHRVAKLEDLAARKNNCLTSDSDWITFKTTVSTSSDQIAIAPGYLKDEWQENGRRYFRYEMDVPILHFFSYLSAAYTVRRDHWNDVEIAVYHHQPHDINVDRMIKAVKKTLDYCTTNFSSYQHQQVRILEFPRYASFAQSFPNTIPYSESIGFIADINDSEEDIDTVFYVTAHEVAHQWWAHQVIGANTQGASFLSESLAQYTALMVMEHEYGPERMRRFLKYELDEYLDGRGGELVEEMPLIRVENQPYIHYRKGSVVMYALRDAFGENQVNQALSQYIDQMAFQKPPYTVSTDLFELLKNQITEPWQQAMLSDSFEHITLFSNEVSKASHSTLENGRTEVELTVLARKYRANGEGVETEVPLDDWVDIGLFADDDAQEVLVLEKRHLTAHETTFTFELDRPPVRAGVDPFHKLIDRETNDNLKKVERRSSAPSKVAQLSP